MATPVEGPRALFAAWSPNGLAADRRQVIARAVRYASIGVQLALVLVLVRAYQLQSRTFFHLAALAAAGWVVHSVLPRALRLPFFALLSVSALVVAFGWRAGTTLFATGLVLIGACHLPIRWGYRVAVLLALGAVLAAGRANLVPFGWGVGVWAVLGSMFMFRLALYMQAVRQEGFRFNAFRSLAYFFMLPNLAFPLYPVVDYRAFERNHYDADALDIYDTGMLWIARGLLQLILYRVVYQVVVPDAGAVLDLTDLIRFVLGTFLLYLRVSGSFHLVVGMLCLYGFRLPETHHLYFLSSGFLDFWRRINIYWKDFMMKLVYYPSFFRLRKWGTERAMVLATLIVFVSTWLLHSYQWFWLRGGFPLTAQDLLFWGLLGVLVVRASAKEMRRSRPSALERGRWSGSLAVRTVGTFVALCVLWSLWSSESVMGWLWMWHAASNADTGGILLLGGLLAAGFLVSGWNWGAARPGTRVERGWIFHPAVRSVATLVILLGLARTDAYERAAPRLAALVGSAKTSTLSRRDEELQHRGYYEKLDNPSRMSADLWANVAAKPAGWDDSWKAVIRRVRPDFLGWELVPSASSRWNGVPVNINRWGMHDRDYAQPKPPGTYRIAFLGQSHVMGTFMQEDDVFDNVLEDRLNALASGSGTRFELLNFGVTDYSLTQQYASLDVRVLAFAPDVVVLTAAPNGRDRVVRHLLRVAEAGAALPPGLDSLLRRYSWNDLSGTGLPVPFETLRRLAGRIGIRTRVPNAEALAHLQMAADSINAWAVRESGRKIREAGAVPVLMALPTVQRATPRLPEMDVAERAGFVVIDLLDVWEGRDLDSLTVAPWDTHPNAEGHRVIADRLYRELQAAGLLKTLATPSIRVH